jgi:uncharacterized protein YjbI with pentapeptide repeats
MLTKTRGLCAIVMALAVLAAPGPAASQPRHHRDADFHEQDLSRQQHSHEDFSRANLEGADLAFANFSNSILKNANLRGANLRLTRFRGADLTDADLRSATTAGVDFYDAKLLGANLSGLTLYLAGSSAPADDSELDKLDEREKREVLSKRRDIADTASSRANPDTHNGQLSFRGANLRNAKILGNVANVDFRRADLRGADLRGLDNLQDAIFQGAIYDKNTLCKMSLGSLGAVQRSD